MAKYKSVTLATSKKFSSNIKNRNLDKAHMSKISGQIVDMGGMEIFPPITVNTVTNNVIDGQHRLYAYIKLVESGILPPTEKIDVKFVQIPAEKEAEYIVKANTNSKNWSLDNFIDSYSQDNAYYSTLKEWCTNHTLCFSGRKAKIRYAAAIITGKNCSTDLSKGTVTFSDKQLRIAENVHSELTDILDALGKPTTGCFIEGLAVEWHAVRKKHAFSDWINTMKRMRQQIAKLPSKNKNDWKVILAVVSDSINSMK